MYEMVLIEMIGCSGII